MHLQLAFLLFDEKSKNKNPEMIEFFNEQKDIFDIKTNKSSYKSFTDDKMYSELCETLKTDIYYNQDSILSKVFYFY